MPRKQGLPEFSLQHRMTDNIKKLPCELGGSNHRTSFYVEWEQVGHIDGRTCKVLKAKKSHSEQVEHF